MPGFQELNCTKLVGLCETYLRKYLEEQEIVTNYLYTTTTELAIYLGLLIAF